MNLFIFIFATIGMTMILVDSKMGAWIKGWRIWGWINLLAFKKFSWVAEMLKCHLCAGFWCGMFCASFTLTGFEHGWWNIPYVFLGGCAGSFLAYFATWLITYLEANSIVAEGGGNEH